MKNILWLALIGVFCALGCNSDNPKSQQAGILPRGAQQQLTRFEKEIEAFEKADAVRMPPQNAILFVGSSSIRLWPALDSAFAPLPVIQRGFGGSTIPEVIYYADRIVWKYKPAIIVFYCGENDIAEGSAPAIAFQRFKEFIALKEKHLPNAQLVVLSAKPSPARWHLWSDFQRFNYMVQQFAANRPDVLFIDLSFTLLNADGKPDPSLYVEDQLHLNRQGYARWERVLKPILLELYNKANTPAPVN